MNTAEKSAYTTGANICNIYIYIEIYYVCVYIHIIIYVIIHTYIHIVCIYIYTHTHICIYTHMCIYISSYVRRTQISADDKNVQEFRTKKGQKSFFSGQKKRMTKTLRIIYLCTHRTKVTYTAHKRDLIH